MQLNKGDNTRSFCSDLKRTFEWSYSADNARGTNTGLYYILPIISRCKDAESRSQNWANYDEKYQNTLKNILKSFLLLNRPLSKSAHNSLTASMHFLQLNIFNF